MTENKKSIGGRRALGRDYSRPLAELLPEVIGSRARTIPEIAEETQRSTSRVRTFIQKLRETPGAIHIKGWKRGLTGGVIMPRYLLGPGDDAEKIKPLTNKQRIRRYLNTDKGAAAKARARAKRHGVRSVISNALKTNPLMSVLYGASTP